MSQLENRIDSLAAAVQKEKAAISDIVEQIDFILDDTINLVEGLYDKFSPVLTPPNVETTEPQNIAQTPGVGPMIGASPLYDKLYAQNDAIHTINRRLAKLKNTAEV